MIRTGVKEARKRLSEYLVMAQNGQEVIITRRDEPVAKLVPIRKARSRPLKSHQALRKSIRHRGKPLSEIVVQSREEHL
ncbi:MAG: type II toxin-antitoxin system prevent-host-death family antitoxin [Thermodesulfobacteriota bacterium]